ncbi:MAG: hypothetical protein HFF09_01010 [Oscillospiraceae bacterium]|nr:hypothetical protein [Oscillospiraceae bacterium]
MRFIQRFMYGRYGGDQLSLALLLAYFILNMLRSLMGLRPFAWVALAVAVWAVYRILSRNIEGRRKENARFLAILNPLVRWVRMRHTIRNDKEHCYFKCPNCGKYLRVPRGKGKINVTCRNCGVSFEEKS